MASTAPSYKMPNHPTVDTHQDDSNGSDSPSPPNSPGAIRIPPASTPAASASHQSFLRPHNRQWGSWGQADYLNDKFIRGPTYLHSQHKIAARQPAMDCVELEVLTSKQRLENAAGRAGSPVERINRDRGTIPPQPAGGAKAQLLPVDPSFTLVINFMVPLKEESVYVIGYYKHRQQNLPWLAAPPVPSSSHLKEEKVAINHAGEYADEALEATARSAFVSVFHRFVTGDAHYRDTRLKFIPHLIEGPWVVKKAMGTKPAVLGTKLKQIYHSNAAMNYFEIDIDVCSSKVAANIFGVVKRAARDVVIDMSWVVEGKEEGTLPEVLLAATRLGRIDSSKAVHV